MKKLSVILGLAAVVVFASPVFAQLGDNTNFGLAWHEASDDVFVRGYVLTAGLDIDKDGKGEILTYDGDGGERIVYLFEADGDNSYSIIWQYQFSDGTAGIVGGERGCMVADLDNDGFEEIVVIMDSYHPDSTALNGFNAGHVFEWDGTDNGLPSTPTLTFDPPRDDRGQVRLEYNTTILQMDDDANPEIVMTHRGGHGMWLSIMELVNSDLGSPVWNVEFEETFPASDTVHYQMKNTGFGITDIDHDGHKEIIMFDDNTGLVRVYENTGTDAYAFVAEWTVSDWTGDAALFAAASGTKARVACADFNMDGVDEFYLADRHGQVWVVTPGGNVATMFDAGNFHLLHDWKTHMGYNETGEQRGCLVGDLDRDGKPDIYIAGNNFAAIMDMEWDGGVGGVVTDPDNYSYYDYPIDEYGVASGRFARPSGASLADMDNDGHQEIVAIVPWTGDNPVPNLRGLYVFEFECTPVGIDVTFPDGIPSTYSLKQNYPNPFNPITEILYELPRASRVTLDIYNVLGQKVNTLVKDKLQEVGTYRVSWDATDNRGAMVASGVYFYKIETGDFKATRKMVLLR